jgi:hypothetical protein
MRESNKISESEGSVARWLESPYLFSMVVKCTVVTDWESPGLGGCNILSGPSLTVEPKLSQS